MREEELQRRLTRLAERTAPPPRGSLARTVVAQHRTRRRQVIGLTTVLAAVAALVVAMTTLVGPAERPVSAVGVASPAEAVDVFTGPTRGSLAGDAAFVEGVRQLPWTTGGSSGTGLPDAPLDTRRVVFAGDVAGGRWALVVGANTAQPEPPDDDPARQTDLGALSDVAIAWFTGPPGASPDQLALQSVPRGVDPSLPAALHDPASGDLVVVTAPGDAVELSLRPDIAADGRVSRAWQPVGSPDGLAVLALPPLDGTYDTALRYRVTRDGAELTVTGPDGVPGSGPAEVSLTWLRPPPAPAAGDAVARSEIDAMLGRTGLTSAETTFTAVWAGDVPGPHDQPARVILLAQTVPSGAVYLSGTYGWPVTDGGGTGGTGCGSQVTAAGAPLDERTFALRCDVVDGTAEAQPVSSLVVIAPPAAVSARALDAGGAVLAGFPLVDGVGVVPFPERTATIETRAADGTVLQSTRPLTCADLGG